MRKALVLTTILVLLSLAAAAYADTFAVVFNDYADGSSRSYTVVFESDQDLVAIPCRGETTFYAPDWPTSQARIAGYGVPRCRIAGGGPFNPNYN